MRPLPLTILILVALRLSPLASGQAYPAPDWMAYAGPGSFLMGRADGNPAEGPVHRVEIGRAFLIARHEITAGEYLEFCLDTGRTKPRDMLSPPEGRPMSLDRPASSVTWYDAVAYCDWRSLKEGLQPCYSGRGKLVACDFEANGYRLPTEAEWEYAARGGPAAGEAGALPWAGFADPAVAGWYGDNSGDMTHPVGGKAPNPLGLFDMCGNMFEWCWDWYEADYYAVSPPRDPTGPPPPSTTIPWKLEKVRRSGSWRESAWSVTVASRSRDYAGYVGDNGFRLARTAR